MCMSLTWGWCFVFGFGNAMDLQAHFALLGLEFCWLFNSLLIIVWFCYFELRRSQIKVNKIAPEKDWCSHEDTRCLMSLGAAIVRSQLSLMLISMLGCEEIAIHASYLPSCLRCGTPLSRLKSIEQIGAVLRRRLQNLKADGSCDRSRQPGTAGGAVHVKAWVLPISAKWSLHFQDARCITILCHLASQWSARMEETIP